MSTPAQVTEAELDAIKRGHGELGRYEQLRLKNAELRKEFNRFVDHFKCFEHTSSDPSDKVAFERARSFLK